MQKSVVPETFTIWNALLVLISLNFWCSKTTKCINDIFDLASCIFLLLTHHRWWWYPSFEIAFLIPTTMYYPYIIFLLISIFFSNLSTLSVAFIYLLLLLILYWFSLYYVFHLLMKSLYLFLFYLFPHSVDLLLVSLFVYHTYYVPINNALCFLFSNNSCHTKSI